MYSPTIRHEIEEATFPEKSPVRIVTFFGGLFGITAGFALAIMCSLDWPLRVSSKDILSIPGFVVIGYECLILIAALSTFAALLHFCRIPNILRKAGYDPRFNDDKFGIVVGVPVDKLDKVKDQLLQSGADEVDIREGL